MIQKFVVMFGIIVKALGGYRCNLVKSFYWCAGGIKLKVLVVHLAIQFTVEESAI